MFSLVTTTVRLIAILKSLPYLVDFKNIQNKGFSLESFSKGVSVSFCTYNNLQTFSFYCSFSIYFLSKYFTNAGICKYCSIRCMYYPGRWYFSSIIVWQQCSRTLSFCLYYFMKLLLLVLSSSPWTCLGSDSEAANAVKEHSVESFKFQSLSLDLFLRAASHSFFSKVYSLIAACASWI